MPITNIFAPGLYAITDTDLLAGHLRRSVEAALQGGVRVLQYRDKSTFIDRAQRMDEALVLLHLCRQHGIPLLIDDDIELALATGADGVHLGQSDTPLQVARARLGPDAIIGATCHDSLELAAIAAASGASYLAFGAMYPSPTKPDAPSAQLATLTAARRFGLPVVAIGGIRSDNAAPVIAAGADNVAVISDLWNAPDITARAKEFARLFAKAA
jgi:thiamine-phosphate pyrophosphorylase